MGNAHRHPLSRSYRLHAADQRHDEDMLSTRHELDTTQSAPLDWGNLAPPYSSTHQPEWNMGCCGRTCRGDSPLKHYFQEEMRSVVSWITCVATRGWLDGNIGEIMRCKSLGQLAAPHDAPFRARAPAAFASALSGTRRSHSAAHDSHGAAAARLTARPPRPSPAARFTSRVLAPGPELAAVPLDFIITHDECLNAR